MRLSDLEKQGLSPRVIELWRKRQGESLLPVQSRAIRKGLLGGPGDSERSVSMLISAPTSSGKSFCAEIAALKALTKRRKSVMLFPLKSLAEQQYELLRQTYGELGVKVTIATGDHPENDQRFADGDYQIAVAIYEKFDQLLTASLDVLKNIGLVVVDEIQTVSEPGRGAILERLLTKIIASVYRPSLIGLSAVIGDDARSAGQLADWLGAVLVEETVRPVDLVRGVAAEGSFRFRSFNDGLDGSEPFVRVEASDDPFDCFVRHIKSDEGSTMVFLKSRQETIQRAFRLAAAVNWPAATGAIEQLADEEDSFLVRSLKQALGRGVAFHSSDLSPRQRNIVEQSFADKEVKALFSTTTLAMGVNLWADTVYVETVRYSGGVYDSRPSLIPVSRAEFDNMTGRAGRLRAGSNGDSRKPGRAIVLAESEFDRDILWEQYIATDETSAVKSAFASLPLEDWLLNMIVTGLLCDSEPDAIDALYGGTFHAVADPAAEPPDFETAMIRLIDERLVVVDRKSGRLSATSVGEAATKAGLTVGQAVAYRHRLRESLPETDFGWIALALSGPDWQLPPAILSRWEQSQSAPLRLLHQNHDHLIGESRFLLGSDYRREPLAYRRQAALKALLLLEQWRRLTPVQKLEECFQMHLGQILSLGTTAAHLIASIARLIEAIDRETPLRTRLAALAFSVRTGLPYEFSEIYQHLGEILNRADFLALKTDGIESLVDLCEMSPEDLTAIIKSDSKRKQVNGKMGKLKEEVYMDKSVATSMKGHCEVMPQVFAQPESIEIDGSYERERYLVRINGFPVRLTGKSFKYFTKLAWSRLNRESGWIYKEDLEIGFNQARYLYRMKGEVNTGISFPWSVVENNRLGYYRLDIDPSKISFKMDNLRNHPDYELQCLVAGKPAESIN